jgi:TetR/AcrR family transcriptional repressor of nem operon
MRYRDDHKHQTRERIMAAAGRVFRQHGYAAAGVDAVMKEAGLTHGGFYAHFPSKAALLSAMLEQALQHYRERLVRGLDDRTGVEWLRAVVRRYLSRTHRDAAEEGCAMPALISELSRAPADARHTFTQYLRIWCAEFEPKVPSGPGEDAADRALATIALSVGGLALARAVDDPALSDRILRACRRLAVPEDAHPSVHDQSKGEPHG